MENTHIRYVFWNKDIFRDLFNASHSHKREIFIFQNFYVWHFELQNEIKGKEINLLKHTEGKILGQEFDKLKICKSLYYTESLNLRHFWIYSMRYLKKLCFLTWIPYEYIRYNFWTPWNYSKILTYKESKQESHHN